MAESTCWKARRRICAFNGLIWQSLEDWRGGLHLKVRVSYGHLHQVGVAGYIVHHTLNVTIFFILRLTQNEKQKILGYKVENSECLAWSKKLWNLDRPSLQRLERLHQVTSRYKCKHAKQV
jgi:hypothetical protein